MTKPAVKKKALKKICLVFRGYISEDGVMVCPVLHAVYKNKRAAELECYDSDYVERIKQGGELYLAFDERIKKKNDALLNIVSLRKVRKLVEREVV